MPRIIDADIVLPYLEVGYREQQADWEETDSNKVSFIKNKPVIPDAQVQADWGENDPTKKSHILNRTHYAHDFNPIIESKSITFSIDGNTTKSIIYNLTLSEGYYWIRIRGREGIYRCTRENNVYTIQINDNPDDIIFTYISGNTTTTAVNTTTLNSHTTYFSISSVLVEKIDDCYLNDTIARVSQIELLDGNATIASETNSIVTIKGGVKQEDGLISNSSANDITLAKVAKTGEYADLANTPNIASIADGEIAIHNADADAHNGVDGRVSTIEGLIPSQTYDPGNELADKTFVNSSIATNTATFKGTFNLVSDLSLSTSSTQAQIGTALGNAISQEDNNDYSFVLIPTSDSTPTEIDHVDRYKYNGADWVYEYTLNNSGFTAAQWSAINSGATTTNISQIATNTGNISTNATNISQLNSDLNQNYPYIGVSTNWGTTANNCYLRSAYFKNGIVPQKKGDLVFSQGTRNFHRCGDLVWDAGQNCYKTTPTFLFHLGEDNINPDWAQSDTTKKDYINNKPITLEGYGITDAKIESGTITLGSNTITPLTQHQDISGKADKVASATNGNFAGLDSNGNLTDSGKKASDFKTKQTAVVDPAATTETGVSVTAIDSISQNENGVITPTKKTVTIQDASSSQKGLMSSSDFSKLSGIASGAEVNQNAFSKIAVSGQTTVEADAKTDTLTLVAGSNVTLTTDATNDKVTIAATDTTYTSKAAASGGTDVSLVTTGEKYTWNNKLDKSGGTMTGALTLNGAPTENLHAATKKYVDDSILALPEPMIFKGSLGTGGTITTLPTASASNEGFTYKVITAGTYAGQTAKIGDTFISDGSAWVLIPSGDEPSGTVTSIQIQATSPIEVDDSTAITTSGVRTISVKDATTSQKGVVQLSNSYNGTSETKATTEKALKDGLATKQASGSYKTTQTAKTDPTASGNAVAFIDSIVQNTNGEITATKKSISSATTSQTGIVQLSNSYSGTSETEAVTEKALSDGLATKQAAGNYKTTQSPVTDPTASGTSTTAITNITQDANGVIIPTKKTITDTKNTAGSTDTSSKIYLVGATSQAANPQTYSDNEVYAQNGLLEAKEVQVNEAAKFVWDSTNQCMRITFN